MQNFIIFLFLFLFLLTFPIYGSSEVIIQYPYRYCSNATFSPNTTYFSNLNLLSSSLSSNSSHKLYFNASVGRRPDHSASIYGHFQCRGDLNASACHDCVTTATSNASQQYCPLSTEAVIWFDECLLRYSNKSIFSVLTKRPSLILINSENIGDKVDRFNKLVVSALSGAAAMATNVSVEERLMFATMEAGFENETIHALAQCTGDLSRSNCEKCLKDAVKNFPTCCSGKKGGRVLFPSCTVRYELYAFYNTNTVPTPSPAPVSAPVPPPALGGPPTVTSTTTSAPAPSTAAPPPLSGKSRTIMAIVIGIVAASLLS